MGEKEKHQLFMSLMGRRKQWSDAIVIRLIHLEAFRPEQPLHHPQMTLLSCDEQRGDPVPVSLVDPDALEGSS